MRPSMRAELTEDDVVVEHIHEEAKTEEVEKEDGTKETKEVSPAKELVKINKRPVSLSDTTAAVDASIPMSAPMRNTKSFTARYSMTTRSRCSGST